MRGAVLRGPGRPLEVMSLSLDEPREGEVRVRMLASGVCHSDVHRADGDWGPVDDPVVLGHEGAAVIEELGPGVSDRSVGDLVALNWNVTCGSCTHCAADHGWLCLTAAAGEHLMPDGTTRISTSDGTPVRAYLGIGTFAEQQVVPVSAAIPIPEVAPEVAALIGCCVVTGYGAVVNAARVRPGATVAVIGLGGVGLSAVMAAAHAGAREVIAVDVAPAKLALARAVGATSTVDARDGDPVAAIARLSDGGADVTIECAGTARTAEVAVAAAAVGGTALFVGMPSIDATAAISPYDVVLRSVTVVGVNYGWSVPSRDFPRIAALVRDGSLPVGRLVDERIALDNVGRAMDLLRRGEGARRVIVFD